MSFKKTLVLITGANQGLGFETAKILLSSASSHVILGSRKLEAGQKAAETLRASGVQGAVDAIQLDVTDDASVDAAAKHIGDVHGRLDVLVNNAGTTGAHGLALRDVFREVLAVNMVGVVSVTEAFLPLLRKAAQPRLVFVGSRTGSMTHSSAPDGPFSLDNNAAVVRHIMGYRSSKAGLHQMMILYNKILSPEGFKVHVADPGLNATNLGGVPEMLKARGAPDPSVGGGRIAMVVRGERDADAGKICGEYDGELGVCAW